MKNCLEQEGCVISHYKKSRGKEATSSSPPPSQPSRFHFLLSQLSRRTWSLTLALHVSQKVTISKHPQNTFWKWALSQCIPLFYQGENPFPRSPLLLEDWITWSCPVYKGSCEGKVSAFPQSLSSLIQTAVTAHLLSYFCSCLPSICPARTAAEQKFQSTMCCAGMMSMCFLFPIIEKFSITKTRP